ncbi:MAG: prepilin peptidase [Enhydrobacter sp.]|nr:prepilin peptidase [Enhydrobacter sp.]
MLLAAVLAGAAAQDLRTRRIANGFSISIVALFAVFAIAGLVSGRLPTSSIGAALACAVLVYCVGAGAFAIGALGGGDVKLLAAVSLFAGSARLLELLAVAALAGGVLGVATLAGTLVSRSPGWDACTLRARLSGDMPFGPAIAAGGAWIALSPGLS